MKLRSCVRVVSHIDHSTVWFKSARSTDNSFLIGKFLWILRFFFESFRRKDCHLEEPKTNGKICQKESVAFGRKLVCQATIATVNSCCISNLVLLSDLEVCGEISTAIWRLIFTPFGLLLEVDCVD